MGWPLAVVFVFVTAGNLAIVYRWFVLRRHGALVPFIGGAAGAIACFLLPADSVRHCWFIPLLVDPGAVPLIVITAAFVAGQFLKQLTNGD
jgi:uncharacterized membrane protein HdeD (DUF308 family)